jgi:hypothetical protein
MTLRHRRQLNGDESRDYEHGESRFMADKEERSVGYAICLN